MEDLLSPLLFKQRSHIAISPTRVPLRSDFTPIEHHQLFTEFAMSNQLLLDIAIANDASGQGFNVLHPGLEVNRDRRLLMGDSNDLKTIFSASNVESFTSVRAELRIDNCVFEQISVEALLAKLANLESYITREQMHECESALYRHFTTYLLSPKISEADVYDGLNGFFTRAGGTLSDRFNCCESPILFRGRLSGARGILARLHEITGAVDPDAGYCGYCDALMPFGHASFGGKNLIAAELKFFDTSPSTDIWYAQENSSLAQLLGSMVGHEAHMGLYFSNFGFKLLLIDRPANPQNFTKCFVCDVGNKIMPLHANATEQEKRTAFSIFLELLRLGVRHMPAIPISEQSHLVTVHAAEGLIPHINQHSQLLHIQTTAGSVVTLEPVNFTDKERSVISEMLQEQRDRIFKERMFRLPSENDSAVLGS